MKSVQTFVLPRAEREVIADRLHAFVLAALPGKRIKVTVEEDKPKRSDVQNNALWGVAYPPLMEHMGLSGEEERQELHEVMCGMFWGWTEYEIMGQRKKKPKRTTTRNEDGKRDVIPKLLFCEFYNFIQRQAADIGVYIPDPDPLWWQNEK